VSGSEPHVVAVGVFDGVHRGHQQILARAKARADAAGVELAVVTFEPHPDAVLGKTPPRPPLTPVGEKRELLGKAGAARVEILHFDREMAALEPEVFVRRYLIDALAMIGLVAGQDFALGRARKGTMAYLSDLGLRWGFTVESVPLLHDDDGPVSSTRIRTFLAEGRVADAARLLGRPYRIEAQVGKGLGLGKELGFPTANLELLEHQALPADGIYAVFVTTPDGVRRRGAMSIGVRPTLGEGERTTEVFVLDFDGDLRGRPLLVEFVAWLHEERRYESLDALRLGIAEDVRETRRILSDVDASRDGGGGEGGGSGSGTSPRPKPQSGAGIAPSGGGC
jgi:riboflavin kinase/FMN adenylyltransferase